MSIGMLTYDFTIIVFKAQYILLYEHVHVHGHTAVREGSLKHFGGRGVMTSTNVRWRLTCTIQGVNVILAI